MTVREHLGKVAYEAYCELRGWKSYDGKPLPQWADVKPEIKEGWIVAATAVVKPEIKEGWIVAATAVRRAMREYIEDIKLLDTLEPIERER